MYEILKRIKSKGIGIEKDFSWSFRSKIGFMDRFYFIEVFEEFFLFFVVFIYFMFFFCIDSLI